MWSLRVTRARTPECQLELENNYVRSAGHAWKHQYVDVHSDLGHEHHGVLPVHPHVPLQHDVLVVEPLELAQHSLVLQSQLEQDP